MEVDQENHVTAWEGYVDWRNKPALKGRHGGMIAASFVLVVEIMENLAYLANASNLVMYLSEYMHLSPSKSANHVTNFMGTAFLLALLGGFLCDAFFTAYHIYLISAIIEFLGLIVLTIQARSASLKPGGGEAVGGGMAAMLFGGLYLVALGVGGIKGSLPAHGAEQFDEASPRGRKQRSTFFNYFVFCLACGALLAVTLVVWIEDNKGWEWGFGISTLTILLSIPVFLAGSALYRNKIPTGSPLTTILKVVVGAVVKKNKCIAKSPSNAVASMGTPRSEAGGKGRRWAACTGEEVEDVRGVVRTVPVFLCTVMLNCCLAQLSTFSVHQAATMDRRLGRLTVPPASLPVFPVVFIMAIAPLYDHLVVPFFRRATKSEAGVSHLQRIAVGLLLSVLAMAVAALVETKRRRVRALHPDEQPLPITFLWIALQYLFLGSADLFTLAGLLEFFFTEAPAKMRSLATSLSWASLAMGYYLSTAIVSIVNRVTKSSPWLSGADINEYRLDRFYWLMCVLSTLNFLHYLFWANKYKYRCANPNT